MSDLMYRPEHTALLFVDPYNDFLSEGGKLWSNVAPVAKEVRLLENVIVVGLLANTCIEGTSRFATELGYRVTLVRDATAAFSADGMHAAHQLNGPTFAHAIVTTPELVATLQEAATVVT